MKIRSNRNRKDDAAAEPAAETPKAQTGLTRLFDIPASAITGACQIEISGNNEAVVDGCQGVLEYDNTGIKLATNKMSVKFTGRGLQIRVLTRSSAVVEGFITGIEFIT